MATLTTQQKATLGKSSRQSLANVFGHLKRHFRYSRWIANSNTYRYDTIDALKNDTGPGGSIAHRHLAQYIAASAPLHSADGWAFLGRALHCHNRGDADAARHLAYYAELRAAMALLAAEGVGIFSHQHFVVEDTAKCHLVPKSTGTHEFSWLSLEDWAGRKPSAQLLGAIIAPDGIPLSDWLDGFQAGPNLYPIGQEWLRAWGIDLRRLADDRAARNEASYRPTRISSSRPLDAPSCSTFLCDFWAALNPSVHSRFEILDRHLLRESLKYAWKGSHGTWPERDPEQFRARVQEMLNVIAPSGPPEGVWLDFLTRVTKGDTARIITEASGTLKAGASGHHVQVLARATLLLRVATGASARLLREAGFGRTDLEFWWKPLGEDRGLWASASEPNELIDLWADVDTALSDLEAWETATPGTSPSFHHLWQDHSPSISVLEEGERIALWGLGL